MATNLEMRFEMLIILWLNRMKASENGHNGFYSDERYWMKLKEVIISKRRALGRE